MGFLLYPFSVIYNSITTIRNWLFDYNILVSKSYAIPIICVGNLSVGGSGKTPQIKFLINLLKKEYKVAVLSRGYGRNSSGLQYIETTTSVSQAGDEPLLIKQTHPECLVVVEKNRNKGVQSIMNDHPEIDVILLDDGFQHRWIKAGLNILLTPYNNPFSKDHLLPLGKLRENSKGAIRASIIIFSKCPEKMTPIEKKGLESGLHLFAYQNLYFSTIKYNPWKCLTTAEILQEDNRYSITLVSGIAHPLAIVTFLENKGHTISHLNYDDHHNYSSKDIKEILSVYNKDKSTKKLILTTEKDAVKLNAFKDDFGDANIYVLPINIAFEKQEEFEKQILNYVENNKRNS